MKGKLRKKVLEKIYDDATARHVICEASFLYFAVYYFREYFKYNFAEFHYLMFDTFDRLVKRKDEDDFLNEAAFIMFRESGKSSLARLFVVWCICYKKKTYINYDSYDKENSEQALFDVVSHLQTNMRLVKDFGQLFNRPAKNKNGSSVATMKKINSFVTNNGVRVEAFSTQESPRGRLFKQHRPDLWILDDIENDKTKESQKRTSSVIDHVNELRSGMAPDASVLYLGNYITEYGSIAFIQGRLRDTPNNFVLNVPVIDEGEPVWPAKYVLTDQEKIDYPLKVSLESKRRDLGSSVFETEMMNNPYSGEDQEFEKGWFKYREYELVQKMETTNYMTIDPAVSSTGDFTGICINFLDTNGHWNLIAYKKRMNVTALVDTLFDLYNKYNFRKIGIERTTFTYALDAVIIGEEKKRNQKLPIVPLPHNKQSKEGRIRALVGDYERGTVFHIQSRCRDLEMELLKFPISKYDDVADATSYMKRMLKGVGNGGRQKVRFSRTNYTGYTNY